MPFTPFHFGPAAALKAVAPTHFSFLIFCYAQVVTDLESGYYLIRGEYPVHRFLHTYLGATLVALGCALSGRVLGQLALRGWQRWFPRMLTGLRGRSVSISWRVAFLSAALGTYSHVCFDSIMHRDMTPRRPFTEANPMLQVISLANLHWLCLGLGMVGVLWLSFRLNKDHS